uniref:Auxin efflux carrier family protein n=1 Tax=Kalanchoe fedtschenkoi TaxID=63787 RepID=A0A7N0ZZN2_KALFE
MADSISQMIFDGGVKSGRQVVIAVMPLMKLLTLTVVGLVLAHPRFQMIPRATFKLLSKLVFALFLPCLIFTQLGESITLDSLARWWFIPVNVLISTLTGFILGFLVVMICQPPPQFVRFTIVMTAFGNTGNLPLALVGSVCRGSDNPFGLDCDRKGVAYVSFAQWVSVILVYTLVYHMMEPPLQYYELVEENNENDNGNDNEIQIEEQRPSLDLSRPLLVEAEWPGMDDKETTHSKTPFIARVFNSLSGRSQSAFPDLDLTVERDGGSSPRSITCMAEPRVVRRMRTVAKQTPIRHILQPPTIASLLAIVIGLVPQMRSLVFGDDAPLSFVTDSLEIIGAAMVPSVMLILGGMLAEGPNQSALGLRTTVGIIVARLLVLPVIGIGIVVSANKLNLVLLDDPMYNFVLLVQYNTPSAILLAAIARLRGYALAEASAILFWQHVMALFSLSLYIVVYFELLQRI